MNLVDDPWLPVIEDNGQFRKVGLMELFKKGRRLTDFVLPVSERISITRFLLCLIYSSAAPPSDRAEWQEMADKYEDAVILYLEKKRSLFNLLDPLNPFLQIPDIQAAGKEGMGKVDKLSMNLASGSTETLFDNFAESRASIPLDQIARSLITIQSFSLNGLTSQVVWKGKLSAKSGKRSLLFGLAHAFLIGQSILDSLHLNLMTSQEIAQYEYGVPAWENRPKDFDEVAAHQRTFLGMLVPYRRLIRLSPQGDKMANGAAEEELFFPDPYLAIETVTKARKGKDIGDHFAKISESRDLWRQFGGVLFEEIEGRAPKHIIRRSQVEKLMRNKTDKSFDLWLGAIHADPGVNSKIISVVESRYHFSTYWTSENEQAARRYYEEWIHRSEAICTSLKRDIEAFLNELISDPKKRYPKKLFRVNYLCMSTTIMVADC